MPNLVQRIEFREKDLVIHVLFQRSFWHFGKILFYLITENDSRHVYKAALPKKKGMFFLVDLESRQKMQAEFIGNRWGGEIHIAFSEIADFKRLYVQLEEPFGEEIESPWVTKVPPPPLAANVVVVIPCYDVELYCDSVVREALKETPHVIAVDDGSTDGTGGILDQIAKENPSLHVIHFEKNQGKGSALIAGFKYALEHVSFDVLVTIDADGQHRPSDIPALAEEILKENELVIGERTFALMPWIRQFSNRFIAFCLRLLYPNAPVDTQSGFRAFNRHLIEEIVHKFEGGRYELEFQILICALCQHRKLAKTTISTLYLPRNVSSHFAVWKDSFRILKVLFQHIGKICKRPSS